MKTVLNLLLKAFYWDSLSKIGKNRFVKSSYIWLFLIPLIVKLLSNIKSKLAFTIFGNTIEFDFGLPFKWQLMFIASLLFTISVIIYSIVCPKIILDNKNFTSFLNKGFTLSKLHDYYDDLGIEIPSIESESFSSFVLKDPDSEVVNSWQDLQKKKLSSIFWYLWNEAIEKRSFFRYLTGILFYSGLMIIIFIISKNVIYVFKSGYLF